ncbi:acyl carrier protein [Streptosporangiaceae bacterium NEAU-GS5]|nr:acyl carrier protein [Streptosporangiaceae bacterium NEAU-GS5]
MAMFTQADLVGYMRRAAGEDESISLDGDIAEVTFADLGYDSLAVMEIASLAERELGVRLPEETMAGVETPQQFVDLVNEQLPASV